MAHATLLISCTGRKLFSGLYERQYRHSATPWFNRTFTVNKVVQINNSSWPSVWLTGKVRSGGSTRSPGTQRKANRGNEISNTRGWMTIDLRWQNSLSNWPLNDFQSRKPILFKIKKTTSKNINRKERTCWRGFSEGRRCPFLLLLLGSGFMPLLLLSAGEGLSMKGGLWSKSCVYVFGCSSAYVAVDLSLCVCALVFFVCEEAALISNYFSCR